jgi:imidazolonepropionase-like amidohydrolase
MLGLYAPGWDFTRETFMTGQPAFLPAIRSIAISLLIVGAAGAAHAQKKTAIVGAEVFDGTGAAPYKATVVIADGVIESVTKDGKAPRGATVVNAKGLALLPGFFDLHTHYTPNGEPSAAPQISQSYVATGVTTVNDFHQPPEAYAARREWYKTLPGPHVNFAARMSTTGGHGADWADINTTRWVNTPFAAVEAVKAVMVYKPDVVKVFTDGWRYGSGIDNTSMDLPTLTALVAEVHKSNIPVLTHTVTVERGKIAARADVDVIAHSMQDVEADQELIDLMLKSGTAYAPTLAVYEPVKPGQPSFAPDDANLKVRKARFAISLGNVKKLHDAGVPIALGTDAGMTFTPHGSSTLREMELFVEAGLTPTQALVAGTANSAKALGQTDRGTIEAGKRADIVLVKGKPWEKISDVRNTVRTFVDGKTVFGKSAPKPVETETPAAVTLASAGIADFERVDGRTNGGSLPVTDADGGKERSAQVVTLAKRDGEGHALKVQAAMALRENPKTEVVIPLVPGGVQPVNAKAYKGVTFDFHGEGEYKLGVMTSSGVWTQAFQAGPGWGPQQIAFDQLVKPADDAKWTQDDLIAVRFQIARKPGESAWMEIDNVAFY